MHPLTLPMGLLMRPAPSTPGGGVEFALVDTGSDDSSSSSYTFASRSLGAADADRLILVCASTRANNTISGVTVGGVTATLLVETTYSANGQVAIYLAAVPSGTTGDVVVSSAGTPTRCMMSAYRAVGVSSTPVDTIDGDGTISTASGGVLLGVSVTYYSGGESECTWSPGSIVEDADLIADGIINHSSGFDGATTGASPSVSASWSDFTSVFTAAVALAPA